MKKHTFDRREYLIRIAANRNWRRLRRAARKRGDALVKSRRAATRTIKLVAPEVFSLGTPENRDAVMSFLRRLQQHVKNGGRAIINFDKTKVLMPCGTLLFVAVLNCLLSRYPGRIISNYPTDGVVEQLFQHIGVLSLLGNTPRVEITADNVRYWYLVQGTTTDTSPLKALFATYSSEIREKIRDGLYDSLSEAITNTIQHAYVGADRSSMEEPEKRWWMFSQQKDNQLSVVVCDLGIGIPTSLRQKFGDHLKYYVSRKKRRDTNFIEVAVQSTRSRTRLPHRGKGLPEMLDFVKSSGVGGFLIYSLYGAFAYDAEKATESGHDFRTDIPGTLIQWTVPLKAVRAEQP